jgi:hypothetical protein
MKENAVFGSTVLEVAIGIVFLYLFLSLICSALNEYYSALFSRRAKHLRDSIFTLFNHDDPKGLEFLLDFFRHPLVAGLNPQKVRATTPPRQDITPVLPWFQSAVVLPARLMAQALGLVANLVSTLSSAVRWTADAIRDPFEVGSAVFASRKELSVAARATPTYMPDWVFADAVFAVLVDDSSATRRLRDALSEILFGFRETFPTLSCPATKQALLRQLDRVNTNLQSAINDSTPPREIISAAETQFDTLLAAIPQADLSVQPVLKFIEPRMKSFRASGHDPQQAALLKEVARFPSGQAKLDLIQLLEQKPSVAARGTAHGVKENLERLKTGIIAQEKARADSESLVRTAIAQAKASMRAAAPNLPPEQKIRDHVWNTIETSLSRLSAAVATLPQGQLQNVLAAKVTGLTAQICQEKTNASVTLTQARARIKEIFNELRGTLDGLKAEIDSSKAALWVERAAQSVDSSELGFITLARLRDAVADLPDSQFKAAIRSLMDEERDDLEGLKRNIKIWFNDSMEHVSGSYKRYTQVILMAIALVLACALNADTLEIGRRLWSNSTLRASVSAAAVAFNTDAQARSATSGSGAVVPDAVLSKPISIQAYVQDELKLSVGWTDADLKKLGFDNETRLSLKLDKPQWSRTYAQRVLNGTGLLLQNLFTTPNGLTKIMGLALTVIAASMGAPFWFDILNKLVNVRTAANKPEKTTDEPKKV